MTEKQQPIFHPLSMIATISAIVKGMLEASEEQLKNMTTVIDRPHVLDDEIINRSVKLYNKQNTDIEFFLEQCRRWRKDNPSVTTLVEIETIEDNTQKLRNINNQLLVIIDKCKDLTINKILAKDDMELAIEFLTGKLPFPKK
ncbi:MAG: hypothetical protein ACE1S7_00390 [Candidatus Tisiphia sp.]